MSIKLERERERRVPQHQIGRGRRNWVLNKGLVRVLRKGLPCVHAGRNSKALCRGDAGTGRVACNLRLAGSFGTSAHIHME